MPNTQAPPPLSKDELKAKIPIPPTHVPQYNQDGKMAIEWQKYYNDVRYFFKLLIEEL